MYTQSSIDGLGFKKFDPLRCAEYYRFLDRFFEKLERFLDSFFGRTFDRFFERPFDRYFVIEIPNDIYRKNIALLKHKSLVSEF